MSAHHVQIDFCHDNDEETEDRERKKNKCLLKTYYL